MTRREYEYLIGGTMNRKYKLKNITADMDEEDYNMLYEKKPVYLEDIRAALKGGRTPAEIGAYIRRERPHRWPQSKVIEGAARHIARTLAVERD
jgi:hypothetical protein